MRLDYIISDTNIGATTAALKSVISKAESDPQNNVLVLVPEPKSIAIERELLDLSKAGAFANIYIYSFVRLLSRIGKIDEKDLLSKQTCVMLLRNIILDNADKLVCYKKTAKTVGFAEKIYDTIQQFKSSSFSLEDVKNLAENSSGALKSKMQDISLLFEQYELALSSGYFDDCDRLRKLGEFAKTSDFIKNSEVYIVGFDNVTADMLDVLKEIAANAKSITFSCCYFNEKRKDKYIQDNELFHKFTSVATKLNYPYTPKFVNSGFKGDFWNIANFLYSTEEKVVKSQGNIEIFELESKQKELEFLANRILTEVKNGKRYRDLAVIDADFDADNMLISKVFDEYEIPYFISKSYDVSSHFFVKFIKNSIEVIVSKFSAEKVLKWLSNPIVRIENYATFESYVKEFGINYLGFLENVAENKIKDEEKLIAINEILKFIKVFENKFCEFSKQHTIAEFVKMVEGLAEFFEARTRLEEVAAFEKSRELEIEAEITLAIYEKFDKLNTNLKKFLGEKQLSANEFLQIYLSGFSEEKVNLVPVSVDSVFVQKNADGLYNIKDLFIVGAVDGKFPFKMADTGIIQDSELEEMHKLAGRFVEPKVKDINKREKFTQYELMLLPSEKLILSYPSRSRGSANKPANALKRLSKLFGIEIKKDYKINKFITQKIAEKQFAKSVGEYLLNGDNSVYDINCEYNKLRSGFSKHFSEVVENLKFGKQEFSISNAREIYFVNNKTSISQLESYFACPYNFFAKYGLRLKDSKEAGLTSLDIGTIVHKFAELFTKNIHKFDGLGDEEFEKQAKVILEKSLEEIGIITQKNIAVLGFLSKEVVRLGKYLYSEQEKSSFKNDAKLNEFSFYGNNAVKLQIDENTVISIEGKIDRIDNFGDYIRIIDYKTGETDSNLSSVYFGKKIQLVSYLSATQKINGKKIAGLFYFPIHSDFVKLSQKVKNNYKMQGFLLDNIDVVKYMDCGLSVENPESELVPIKLLNNKSTRETGEMKISYGRTKTFFSGEEFENIKSYTEKLCSGAIAEILDGNIEPSPIAKLTARESLECEYCKLKGFCGKEFAKFGEARRCGGEIDEASFSAKEVD